MKVDAAREQLGQMAENFTTLGSAVAAAATRLETSCGLASGAPATPPPTESDADHLARIKRDVARGWMLSLNEVHWLIGYIERREREAWEGQELLRKA